MALTLGEVERAIRAIPLDKSVEVHGDSASGEIRITVTTDHCSYSVSASRHRGTYLGCIASALSGGGNDLPDGDLSASVLDEICWEIECYDALFSGRARPRRPAQPMGRNQGTLGGLTYSG